MDASPSMPPEDRRELERLRRRAYAEDVDLSRDPRALRRLEELEAAFHRPLLIREQSVATVEAPVRPDVAPAPPAPVLRTERSRSGERLLLAITIVAIGMVCATTITIGGAALLPTAGSVALGPAPSEVEDRQALVDELDLRSFGVANGRLQRYDDFRGIAVWTARARAGTVCLLLRSATAGVVGAACAPPPLHPAVDVVVDERLPAAARSEFGDGSVIHAVESDGAVSVRVLGPVGAPGEP